MNTSMYDAQQGSTSGAHIDMSTASGTNDFHGRPTCIAEPMAERGALLLQAGSQRPTNERFRNCIAKCPGATFGGPIIKNKLFVFVGYQHVTIPTRKSESRESTVPANSRTIGATADWRCAQSHESVSLTCVADVVNTDVFL